MDISSMVQAALPKMRANAESLMSDSFDVMRPTGRNVVDPDTGVDSPELVLFAQSKGKIQTAGGIASQVVTASGDSSNVGGNVPVWSLYIHFPMTLVGLREKDVAVCTASTDSDMVGKRFRLVNLQSEKTHATARRWNVQEMPEGD
ncbi:DUF6093 family protein [Bifidobacterium mongoliense]|uniref:Phage associated protein n=1 Tax=Bifidobacterium mongoliense DSM 21395 TaxID=1437603 RepID=A0A087CAG3_9BIFI|nr:DUF6093 family protein [Bifidobacterium mongoliense]KFI80263.1 phage associated protein [Bifidobacterium mongoliense DSM 21395]